MTIPLTNQCLACVFDESGPRQIVILSTRQNVLDGNFPGVSLYSPTNGTYDATTNPIYPVGTLAGPILKSTVAAVAGGVVVTHFYSGLTVAYTYTLSLHNINVAVAMNWGLATPFETPVFQLGTYQFTIAQPTGSFHNLYPDYLSNVGLGYVWPSAETVDQVAYIIDQKYSLSIHSKSNLFDPMRKHPIGTMVNAVRGGSNPNAPTYQPFLFVDDTIPGQSTYNLHFTIRVVDAVDVPTVKAQYSADFAASPLGKMQYNPDHRPVIEMVATSASPTAITPDNPLGLIRRIDTDAGTAEVIAMLTPAAGLAQSVIIWQEEGANGDPMYSPDADEIPATILPNLQKIIAWGNANGLTIGFQARPNALATPGTPATPATATTPAIPATNQYVQLDADDADQVAMLKRRFMKMVSLGFNSCYADSFGSGFDGSRRSNINDFKLLSLIRSWVGPDFQIFVEQPNTATLSLAAAYCETADDSGVTDDGTAAMAAFRSVFPNSSFICLSRAPAVLGSLTPDLPGTNMDTFGKNKLSPIIGDWTCGEAKAGMAYFNATYLTGKAWR